MKGLIRPSESKPKTIKLRMTVKDIPVGARADVTDLMLQPGESVSGWLPHVTELPWSSGLTFLNTAPTGETVYWDNIEGKPVVFPPESHTHSIQDVTGLQAALDAKQASGDYATTQALTDGLAGKANTSHTHTIANVTNLQTTLNGKASTSHTHGNATSSVAGFMSPEDKAKLDGASASSSTTGNIPLRTAEGRLSSKSFGAVDAPSSPSDLTRKDYVDAQVSLVMTEVASGSFEQGEIAALGGSHIRTVTLPSGVFSVAPSVVAITASPRTTPAIDNITTASFRCRLFNFTDSGAPNNKTQWIAINKPGV